MGYDDITIKIAFGLTGGAVAAIVTSIPFEVINAIQLETPFELIGGKNYSGEFIKKMEAIKLSERSTLSSLYNDIRNNGVGNSATDNELAKAGAYFGILNNDITQDMYNRNANYAKKIAITRAIAFIPGAICGVFTANKLLDKLKN